MPSRAHDWLKQAKRDLNHAHEDLKSGFYNGDVSVLNKPPRKRLKLYIKHLHAEAWGIR